MNQAHQHLNVLTSFLDEIGIKWQFSIVPDTTFLPGLDIINGVLHIDTKRLLYPGDILHEAAHIAVAPQEIRPSLCGSTLNERKESDGEEIVSLLWSYAALRHLRLSPEFVFHPHGYKGQSDWLIESFSGGTYIGMPLLEWMGLAYSPEKAAHENTQPFPHMIKWMRN